MTDHITNSFGVFIMQLRKQHLMTLQQVADRAKVEKSSIHRWESGQSMPRETELRSVLNALSASKSEEYHVLSLVKAPWASQFLRSVSIDYRPVSDLAIAWMPPVGSLLAAMRQRNGLNRNQAARKLGVHPSTLLRWERDEMTVPIERLEDISKLYRLQPQERMALSDSKAFALSLVPRTVDDWHGMVAGYYAAKSQGTNILADLFFLMAEAHLQTLVSGNSSASYVLAEAYYGHSDWLYIQGRYKEAAEFAGRASKIFAETRSTALHIVSEVMLIHSIFPGEQPRSAKSAVDLLHTLLEAAPSNEIAGGLIGDMAHFARVGGQTEFALRLQRQATEMLVTQNEDQEGRDRLLVLANGHAKLLIDTKRAVEAEKYLPVLTDLRPHIQFPNTLVWVRWFIETKQIDAAQKYLDQLIPRLVATSQGRYLRQAQALSMRL